MASTDNNNGKDKKEVMQSNLPLLFANGSPIGLESMNLVRAAQNSELHKYHFVSFRVNCKGSSSS